MELISANENIVIIVLILIIQIEKRMDFVLFVKIYATVHDVKKVVYSPDSKVFTKLLVAMFLDLKILVLLHR
jgi:hypothetical protein